MLNQLLDCHKRANNFVLEIKISTFGKFCMKTNTNNTSEEELSYNIKITLLNLRNLDIK